MRVPRRQSLPSRRRPRSNLPREPPNRSPASNPDPDQPADPYAGGAYAGIFLPGAWTSVGAALATPVGRLHWAGTEASARWPGFIEGVLQAGADAAAAVGAALDVEG